MILVTGGAKSGKSSYAEQLAQQFESVLYVATAIPFDAQMKEKIELHRRRRPAHWDTLEAYIDIGGALCKRTGKYEAILLDCVTVMVTNLLFHFYPEAEQGNAKRFQKAEQAIYAEVNTMITAAKKAAKQVIFVTNELGMGIVPESYLSRYFRDIAGTVNAVLAATADEVYFVVSGIPIKIK